MHSKQFMVELPSETDEFDVYAALDVAGLKYARVKPVDRYVCGCRPDLELVHPVTQRKPWEGVG